MILCEICGRQKATFKITIQTILDSKHIPYGRTRMFGVCQNCLPFEIKTTIVETVEVVKKAKSTVRPL